MKIAVPSTKPDLTGQVEHKLGTASHLLLVDSEDMSFEAVDGPGDSSGPGAGVEALSVMVGMGAQALLVGHIAPHIAAALQKKGIVAEVRVSGPVREAVERFMSTRGECTGPENDESGQQASRPGRGDGRGETPNLWQDAFVRGLRQFTTMLPMLVGVILLLGLFRGLFPDRAILELLSGSMLHNSFVAACMGSLLTGNPVNSYVIGENLLGIGVSVSGVAALMLAWVNVGLVQLPMEASALGWRFAAVRMVAGFFMAVGMGVAVAVVMGLFSGAAS
jgi:predicted Fe-Mo cluster-binding NifX family protein